MGFAFDVLKELSYDGGKTRGEYFVYIMALHVSKLVLVLVDVFSNILKS